MESFIYTLFGAGLLFAILSIFFKKPAVTPVESQKHVAQFEKNELEKTLQRFLQQVKRENEQTVISTQKQLQTLDEAINTLVEKNAFLEQEQSELRKQLQLLQILQKEGEASSITADQQDALLLKERYRRVFEFKEQGMSVDEIAKKLGAGQGEIELIFTLAHPIKRGTADGE